ncbi:hypothetical protein HAX54_025106, partial [Datura stramonium]|nr:hypothetical protein [Datura stramonium]
EWHQVLVAPPRVGCDTDDGLIAKCIFERWCEFLMKDLCFGNGKVSVLPSYKLMGTTAAVGIPLQQNCRSD